MIQLFMWPGHSLFILKRKVNPPSVWPCVQVYVPTTWIIHVHTLRHTHKCKAGRLLSIFFPPFRLSHTCWQGLPLWRALKDLTLESAASLSWRRKWTISGRQADWTEIPHRGWPLFNYIISVFSPLVFRKIRTCSSTVAAQDVWGARWCNQMVEGHHNAESQIYWEEDMALHHVLFPQKGNPGGHFMMLYWPYGHPPPLKQTNSVT